MTSYPRELRERIEANFEAQVRCLKELVAMESVVGEEEGEAPFGAGVQKAFAYMLEQGETLGFSVDDVAGYGGHIQMDGNPGEKTLGIAGHLDTVPIGEDWSHDPLGGEEEEGRIYGRGTSDDKGPVVAILYAMKALTDCGIRPRNNIRLILGLDEETNWIGMERYLDEVGQPDFGFTPDADFPVIRGEMGIMVFDLAKKFTASSQEGLVLRSVEGGTAANMVADQARAIVMAEKRERYEEIRSQAETWNEEEKAQIQTRVMGKSLEIRVTGKAAHGAHPAEGVNAITRLMAFLGTLSFSNEDAGEFVVFFNEHIGEELSGHSLGIHRQGASGPDTIVNVGMIHLDQKAAHLTLNVRYPLGSSDEEVYRGLEPVCTKYDLGVVKGKHEQPIAFDEQDPLIQTLMTAYEDHCDEKRPAEIIGGGTYARAFDHMVAFGARFPGDEDVAHQKDEYIARDRLLTMTHIYADAIYRLACTDDEPKGEQAEEEEQE